MNLIEFNHFNQHRIIHAQTSLKGRPLNKKDIGQKVFRVVSFLLPTGRLDHRMIPNERNEVAMVEFRGFTVAHLKFKDGTNLVYENLSYNDSGWITAKEAPFIKDISCIRPPI